MRYLLSFCAGIALCLLSFSDRMSAETFSEFLARVRQAADPASAARCVDDFMSRHSSPVVEKDRVHFLYRGSGLRVAVPGEMNGWDPSGGMMTRCDRTDLFYRSESAAVNGRLEYKIWVDSTWMLDPLNQKTALGGYGANSDVWMPRYRPSAITRENPRIPHGSLDTLWIESAALKRKHPVVVYTPPHRSSGELLPYLLVTDGIDYLNLGKLHVILDNLIANKRIAPLVAVFVDPKTDLGDPSTNQRMSEYAASDAYLDFLEKEVLPAVRSKFPVSQLSSNGVILGASMGGLISTYASLTRPLVFPNCASQSPSYTQAGSAVIKLLDTLSLPLPRVYIQTGVVHDTRQEAKYVSMKLRLKGGNVRYEEFPEGHNWTNWSEHVPKMLEYFFPRH